MPVAIADPLVEHDGSDVWGITPEALVLKIIQHETETEDAENALRRYYDFQVLKTNYEPGWDTFDQTAGELCEAWFPPALRHAVALVPPDSLASFVAGAAYFDTPSGLANLLVQGQDRVEDGDETDQIVMSRRDVHGYLNNEDEQRLLRSLRIARPTADGYQLNRDVFQALESGFSESRSGAAYEIVARLCEHLCVTIQDDLITDVLSAHGVAPPESPPDIGSGTLSVSIQNSALKDFVSELFSDELDVVLADLKSERELRQQQLRRTLSLATTAADSPQQIDWPLAGPLAAVCAIASQQGIPLAVGWLATECAQSELSIHDELTDAGIDVEYDNGLLNFNTAYESPDGADPALSQYNEWVQNRLNALTEQIQAISVLQSRAIDGYQNQRRRVIETAVRELDEFTISPTKFVYTIFDPEFHADSYSVDQYVGESPELESEVETIRRWRTERPHDATSFAEMVPAIINHPLEADNVEPAVRIMCPWTNFAIQDYVSQFSRLFDNDIEVRLLFRLPEWREWKDLRKNLLSRLGDTDGNLELRSYTRYKQYHDHSELREIEEDDDRYVTETGVHAKLFIAGSPENGNLLAGSANLMENSFYYNPEAGLQTRNPNVIETAIEYFDLVWELAAPDRIPEEAYTGDTEYTFFPAVYRPR